MKIHRVLGTKPQRVNNTEIRYLGISKWGIAGKLLDLRQEAERKPNVKTLITPPFPERVITNDQPRDNRNPFDFSPTPKRGDNDERSRETPGRLNKLDTVRSPDRNWGFTNGKGKGDKEALEQFLCGLGGALGTQV